MNFLKYFTPDYEGVMYSENSETLYIKILKFFEPVFNVLSDVNIVVLLPILFVFAVFIGIIKSPREMSVLATPTLRNPFFSAFLIVITISMTFVPTNINVVEIDKDNIHQVKIISKLENVPRVLAIFSSIPSPIVYGIVEAEQKSEAIGSVYNRYNGDNSNDQKHFFHLGMFADGNYEIPYSGSNNIEKLGKFRAQVANIGEEKKILKAIEAPQFKKLRTISLEFYNNCRKQTEHYAGGLKGIVNCDSLYRGHPIITQLFTPQEKGEIFKDDGVLGFLNTMGDGIKKSLQDRKNNRELFLQSAIVGQLTPPTSGIFSPNSYNTISYIPYDDLKTIEKADFPTYCNEIVRSTTSQKAYYKKTSIFNLEPIMTNYDNVAKYCSEKNISSIQPKAEAQQIFETKVNTYNQQLDNLIVSSEQYRETVVNSNTTLQNDPFERKEILVNNDPEGIIKRFVFASSDKPLVNKASTKEQIKQYLLYFVNTGTFNLDVANASSSSYVGLKPITDMGSSLTTEEERRYLKLLNSMVGLDPLTVLNKTTSKVNISLNEERVQKLQELFDRLYIVKYISDVFLSSVSVTEILQNHNSNQNSFPTSGLTAIKINNQDIQLDFSNLESLGVREIAESIEPDQLKRIGVVLNSIGEVSGVTSSSSTKNTLKELFLSKTATKLKKEHVLLHQLGMELDILLELEKEYKLETIDSGWQMVDRLNYNTALKELGLKVATLAQGTQLSTQVTDIGLRTHQTVQDSMVSLGVGLMSSNGKSVTIGEVETKGTVVSNIFIDDAEIATSKEASASGDFQKAIRKTMSISSFTEPILNVLNTTMTTVLLKNTSFSIDIVSNPVDYRPVIRESSIGLMTDDTSNIYALTNLLNIKNYQGEGKMTETVSYLNQKDKSFGYGLVEVRGPYDTWSVSAIRNGSILPQSRSTTKIEGVEGVTNNIFNYTEGFLTDGLKYDVSATSDGKFLTSDTYKLIGVNQVNQSLEIGAYYRVYESLMGPESDKILSNMDTAMALNALSTASLVIPGAMFGSAAKGVLKGVTSISTKTKRTMSAVSRFKSAIVNNPRRYIKAMSKKMLKRGLKKTKKGVLAVSAASGFYYIGADVLKYIAGLSFKVMLGIILILVVFPIILIIGIIYLSIAVIRYMLLDLLFPLLRTYFDFIWNYIKLMIGLVKDGYRNKGVEPRLIWETLLEGPILKNGGAVLKITFLTMIFTGLSIFVVEYFILGEVVRDIFRWLTINNELLEPGTFALEVSISIGLLISLIFLRIYISIIKKIIPTEKIS